MNNAYDYWLNALDGKFGPVHEGDPQCGFYRKRARKGGPFVPVAIFESEGGIVAVVDGKSADASEIWTYCCEHPVPEEWYRAVEQGGAWPDMDATVARQADHPGSGHNNPPEDEIDVLREQIESAKGAASEYAEISDDETAGKAQSLRARLNELSREADKKRDTLKRPHLEAGKAIDAAWQPLVKLAKSAADDIAKAISAHETRKFKAEQEAKAKALADARRAEEEARRATEAGKPAPAPPLPPTEPELTPAAATTVRGAYGRAASVKIVTTVTAVTDQDALYGFLKTHAELKDLMFKLAQRAVTAGLEVPGVTTEQQRKVS